MRDHYIGGGMDEIALFTGNVVVTGVQFNTILVYNRIYRLKIQSVMLVFVNYWLLPLSPSHWLALSPFPG
jgi:hypothetical protein